MKLRASHYDGFSEHLVRWTLEAEDHTATIAASWFQNGKRSEMTYTMDFPDSRIEHVAKALTGLKSKYDGHIDDFPKHLLSVTTAAGELSTLVRAGIDWPDDERADVDTFMKVWRPIYSDVDKLLALPGRHRKKRK